MARIAGTLACVACIAAQTSPVTLVDVRAGTDARLLLPVQAVAGFANRVAGSMYIISSDDDAAWATLLLSTASFVNASAGNVVNASLAAHAALVYDDSAAGSVMLPTIVTLCGVMDWVPLPASMLPAFPAAVVAFNAVGAWATPLDAVTYAVNAVGNATTTLAFQDPSLLATGQLVDYIVSARLFTSYLNNSCFPGTPEHILLQSLVATAPLWPRPVRVMGYNGMDVVFGGDLYEAETDCINVMGQIASAGTHNLAFWSKVQPFNASAPPGSPSGPMVQPPAAAITYNASQTYVALVWGDMDNLDFVQTFARTHMIDRAARCANGTCFPLTWTLSPNLLTLAPAILRWYYATAATTGGMDHFIMPPSGTLYSYPGQMPADVQTAYAVDQNAQAVLMGTHGSVHWEWILTWDAAWNNYFPRFVGDASATTAFFLNDVPWVIPILDMFLANETYRVLGGNSSVPVVAFRPAFNWQLDGPSGGLPYNASVIADIISALPVGTITYVYVIQNTDTAPLFDMVAALAPHVTLVGYEQLVSLALQQTEAAVKSSEQ